MSQISDSSNARSPQIATARGKVVAGWFAFDRASRQQGRDIRPGVPVSVVMRRRRNEGSLRRQGAVGLRFESRNLRFQIRNGAIGVNLRDRQKLFQNLFLTTADAVKLAHQT